MAARRPRLFNTTAATADEAFREIDANGDGGLDVEELRAAIGKAGAKGWPKSRIQYAVQKFDQDKNGTLDNEEFQQLLSYFECGKVVHDELEHAWRMIEALQGRVAELEASHERQPPAAAASASDVASTGMSDRWTAQQWLLSQGDDISRKVAEALKVTAGGEDGDEFDAVRSLSDEDVELRLEAAGLVGLTPIVTKRLQTLRGQEASTAAELNDKFSGEAFKGEMRYASLQTYFLGLSGLIGDPMLANGELRLAMEAEHKQRPDSYVAFIRSMNKKKATPAEEWTIVRLATSNPQPHSVLRHS